MSTKNCRAEVELNRADAPYPCGKTLFGNGNMSQHLTTPTAAPSPLILCDRLITLAQDADRAGCAATAERLVKLVNTMFRETRATQQTKRRAA
jgi:hypothetical protein